MSRETPRALPVEGALSPNNSSAFQELRRKNGEKGHDRKGKTDPEVRGKSEKQMPYLRETPRVYRQVRNVQDLLQVARPQGGAARGH